MAKIAAGIGSSHVPNIGPAYDAEKFEEPDWKPLFDGYRPVKEWLQDEIKPDSVILVYNDHGSDFALDRVPTFAIGVCDKYQQADEGHGVRPLPLVKGNAELSWFLAKELIYDEFDLTICQEMKVDHGLMVPLPLLFSHKPNWNVKVVPPNDTKVAVIGTGGMSHQLHGERFGHLDSKFDQKWLELLETDPEKLADLSHVDIMKSAGAEAVELIMWLVMRGAMSSSVKKTHSNYYAPMTTGMSLIAMVDS